MNYQIDLNSKTPAYIQLYDFLKKDIVSGTYKEGAKLPSKRTIAQETGLSVITAEHAINLLNEEGYVETRQRSGIFVIYRDSDFQGQSVKLNSVNPVQHHTESRKGDFPFSVLTRTMRKVVGDYGDRILERSPGWGMLEFRNEICDYLARSRGIRVKPEQVVIGSGAEYLYGLIAQMFKDRGKIALENPSYTKIRKVYEAFGLRTEMLDLSGDGIDTQALKLSEASLLHVTPFNSFPSGITAGISKKMEYLKWAADRGGYIVEDNYDSELTVSRKAEDPLFSMTREGNVIYINTFSKTVAPSIRVGYMILPEKLVEEFDRKLGFYSCTVPVLEQLLLAELLKSGDFERHVNRVRRNKRRKHE